MTEKGYSCRIAFVMDKIVEKNLLYDFYGELLTDHQKKIYEDAVYGDYSLSELAEEYGISRQGVHDLLKRCDKILEEYEGKLHMVEKFEIIKKDASEIDSLADKLVNAGKTGENQTDKSFEKMINDIKKASEHITQSL